MTDAERRKLWRKYCLECDRVVDERGARDHPKLPAVPTECVGMRCGAKTRAGTPCKRRDLYINGRCKLHGGLSTGPTSVEGKKKSALNGLKSKRKPRSP